MELYGNGVGAGALRIHKPLHTDFTHSAPQNTGAAVPCCHCPLFLPYPLLSELPLVLGSGLVTKLGPSLATLWTTACQAPLSMEFSRQKYWSGLPFPSLGDLPDPGIELGSPCIAGGFFTN